MGTYRYGFLLDENVMHLKNLFPRGRAKSIAALGLRGKPDSQVLNVAMELGLILVTCNIDDFMPLFGQISANGNGNTHLYGLVGVPSDSVGMPHMRKVAKKLRFANRKIAWVDVSDENLFVSVQRTGRVTVSKLPPCPGCTDQ